MPIASGARHCVAYVAETAHGVTPTNPEMRLMRYTSCGLNLTRDALTSNEIRSDRMESDIRNGLDKVGGDIGFELSFGEFDAMFEAALFGKWDADTVKIGIERHPFTIERNFEDVGITGVYRGCYVNTMSLSVKPNAMVSGTFGIIGSSVDFGTAPLSATSVSSKTGRVYDTYTGDLVSDSGVDLAVVTGLDFSINNNVEAAYPILTKNALDVFPKKANVSGTMTAFFMNRGLLDLFLNDTPSSLSMTIGKDGEDRYTFTFPRVIYTGGAADVSNDGPVTLNMPFTSVFDPTSKTSLQITHIPATIPPAPPVTESDLGY